MAKYKCRFCGFGANWDRNKKYALIAIKKTQCVKRKMPKNLFLTHKFLRNKIRLKL